METSKAKHQDLEEAITTRDIYNFLQTAMESKISAEIKLPKPRPKKLAAAFQGGGAKCLAYAGAIEAYGKAGMYDDLKHVIGSSGGAFSAFLIALGLDYTQFKALSVDFRMADLKDADDSGYLGKYLVANIIWGLTTAGMSTGNNLKIVINYLITQATAKSLCTFRELENYRIYGTTELESANLLKSKYSSASPAHPEMKQFYCTAYNISKKETFYFSAATFPDAVVADALYCSMSLPPLFPGAKIRCFDKNGAASYVYGGTVFRDGGIADNLPLQYMNFVLSDSKANVASPNLIGFGLVTREDIIQLLADDYYRSSIPQDTINRLGISALEIEQAKNKPILMAPLQTPPVEIITEEPTGVFAGPKNLLGYWQASTKALPITFILRQYPSIALYTAEIQSYYLNLSYEQQGTLINGGYWHTKYWIEHNINYKLTAGSALDACPQAVALLEKYRSIEQNPAKTVEAVLALVDEICGEFVQELHNITYRLRNLSATNPDYSDNARLAFLSNLLNNLSIFATTHCSLERIDLNYSILNAIDSYLAQYAQIELIKKKNRQVLFAKIDLSMDSIIQRLKAGILDVSPGADARFLQMFAYLLSRTAEIFNCPAGEELLVLANSKQQFKKIEHMLTVAMHNIVMLYDRFPLNDLGQYFMGYLKKYHSCLAAEEAKKNIASMLNRIMLEFAKSGNLRIEHLHMFMRLGFSAMGVDVAYVDENCCNVLHYCIKNAKHVADVDLITSGLDYLAKFGNFRQVMSTVDNFGKTPMDYLPADIFLDPGIVQLVQQNSTIEILYVHMVQYGMARQGAVFLCAARLKNFSMLDILIESKIKHKLYIKADEPVDKLGKNPLHYIMEYAASMDEADIILKFIHEGSVSYFTANMRKLLCARDNAGKPPLHYLLVNNQNPVVIKTIIMELAKYATKYSLSSYLGRAWYLDEIVDYGLDAAPIFMAEKELGYSSSILAACAKHGLDFIEANVIRYLSFAAQTDFNNLRQVYQNTANLRASISSITPAFAEFSAKQPQMLQVSLAGGQAKHELQDSDINFGFHLIGP